VVASISIISSAKAVNNKLLVSQGIPEKATDGAGAIIGRIFLLPQVALLAAALQADDLTVTSLNAISFIPSACFFLGSAFCKALENQSDDG
jgi:hypothetical protein